MDRSKLAIFHKNIVISMYYWIVPSAKHGLTSRGQRDRKIGQWTGQYRPIETYYYIYAMASNNHGSAKCQKRPPASSRRDLKRSART
jgi:hypothetical protein